MKGEPTGLEPSGTCLTAYNGTPIPQYGALRCPLIWRPGNGARPRWIQTKWYVADTPGPAILGLPTSERLRVITLNCTVWITHETPTLPNRNYKNANHGVVRHVGTIPHPVATPKGRIISKDQLIKEYPDHFEGIGRFPGNHTIHLKDGVRPVINPQWKWPIVMWEKLKVKLQEMEQKGIIIKVTEPTDWVNSLACSWKPNRDLRVCLDPKDLNKAIKQTFHKIPTVKEVTHEFAGSRFFSKLDAKSAFWCIALDEESSYLTTFGTVFGRYQYLIMPYGLIDSQDAF